MIEDFFKNIIFSRVSQDTFLASLGGNRCFIIFGHPRLESFSDEYSISDINWKCIQSRVLTEESKFYSEINSLKKQVWRVDKNVNDFQIKLIDYLKTNGVTFGSLFIDIENKYQILLLHDPKINGNIQYNKNMSFINSIGTYKMILKKL